MITLGIVYTVIGATYIKARYDVARSNHNSQLSTMAKLLLILEGNIWPIAFLYWIIRNDLKK